MDPLWYFGYFQQFFLESDSSFYSASTWWSNACTWREGFSIKCKYVLLWSCFASEISLNDSSLGVTV